MKKLWLTLGVVAAIVALGMGITSAYAQDNGNSGTPGSLFCDEWLLGEIQADPIDDTINLVPKGGDTPIPIAVDKDITNYRAWMAPWQEVTFESLKGGDWIAVCIKDDVARFVILLEAPQKPFYLMLEGNVTEVDGQQIEVEIGEGKTFTIDLSNSGVDTAGIEEGQSVRLTISECKPLLQRHRPGLHLGWFLERVQLRLAPYTKHFEQMLEGFKQRFENWQDQGMLEGLKQRFENWQDQGILERLKQRFENWQDWFGDEANP